MWNQGEKKKRKSDKEDEREKERETERERETSCPIINSNQLVKCIHPVN